MEIFCERKILVYLRFHVEEKLEKNWFGYGKHKHKINSIVDAILNVCIEISMVLFAYLSCTILRVRTTS